MRGTPNITMKKIKRCRRGDAIATRVRRSMIFVDKVFCAVVKTHKSRSIKIYKSELTKIKILNQVKSKYQVDPQRTRLTFIAELTW